MRDLEHVDGWQAGRDEGRIHLLLDVAGQQESAIADRPEQDDRDVVDGRPAVGRLGRHGPADRPAHVQAHVVDGQPVAGRDRAAGRCVGPGQGGCPRRVAGSRTAHPRFQDAADVIAREEHGQAGHVVLVRVGQDDHVESSVPRRQPTVELDEQTVGIGATVDEQPTAA
jgi:hypothetical protein